MDNTRLNRMAILLVIFVITAYALVACQESETSKLPPLPAEDGVVLYTFLLQNAPALTAKIPCSCCDKMLKWCYEGGCPPT